MCLGCMVEEDFYGECLPGIYLMRATKTDSEIEPEMLKDQWGLTIMNGPFIIFDEIIVDPYYGMTDEEVDAIELDDKAYNKALYAFMDACYCSPYQGYLLTKGCIAKGFDPEKGCVESWLYDYLGQYLKTCTIERWADRYPTGIKGE